MAFSFLDPTMSNTRTSYSRSRSPRALLTPIPEAPDCASRKGFSRKGFPRTESAESGGVTPRQDERIARERAVTMNHASAQEDPAPDMITSARGAAKTTELREGPAQRASDARPAMLRRIPAVAVLPVPRLHLEEFFGWQSTKPHQTEASPRTCCLGHSLFEAELPYDTLSDAKLEEVLDMLTSCKEDARRCVRSATSESVHELQTQKTLQRIGPSSKRPSPCNYHSFSLLRAGTFSHSSQGERVRIRVPRLCGMQGDGRQARSLPT